MAKRGNQAEQLFRGQYKALLKTQGELPKVIAGLALRHFKRSFQKEGFTNAGFVKWPEVQRRIPGSKGYNPKQQQKQLTGPGSTGLDGTLMIDRAQWREVKIVSRGKKYALYHNQGTGRLPKRQFMGTSSNLQQNLSKTIKKHIDKIIK